MNKKNGRVQDGDVTRAREALAVYLNEAHESVAKAWNLSRLLGDEAFTAQLLDVMTTTTGPLASAHPSLLDVDNKVWEHAAPDLETDPMPGVGTES